MKHLLRLGAAALLFAPAACSDKVTYEDPEATETINEQFGGSDLLMIAQDMAQSFINSNAWGGEAKPSIVFGGVKNRTQQHVDTVNITDTIQTALIQSGKFTVLAGDAGIEEIKKETDYQQSGAVDMDSAVQLGKQRGAGYVLYGRFTEIAKQEGSTKSRWMKFTLNGVNVETREIVWADEKIISKLKEESFLGW